jgi:ribonuclease BN (tRNA processing enzyme)
MKLTVLGSGTCAPSGVRNSSGYFVEAGPCLIRLDAGAGTVHAMARYGLPWEALTHQFISHYHLDHVGELLALLFALKYGREKPRTAPLTLIGPAGLERLARALCEVYDSRFLAQEFPVEFIELSPGDALALPGGLTLRVEKTPHNAESLAARLEGAGGALGYTGDTGPSDALAGFFRGVDALVAECSFLEDRRGTPHLTADETAALAAASGVPHLIATHFYFDPEAAGLEERLGRAFRGRVTVARDGMVLTVGGRK